MPESTSATSLIEFRPRRAGPEAVIQDSVVESIPELFRLGKNSWAAASVPLGAGMPDLVIVSYDPRVFALASVDMTDAHILAYLRAVGKARLGTIARRMGTSPEKLGSRLFNLVEAKAVATSADTFFLRPSWRRILPEIITVEIKVSKWQRAIEQAARNRIFAHLSYVALPENVARRILSEPLLRQVGIGLICVTDDGTVSVLRKPRRRRPIVWAYYYQLASILARSRSR